MLEDANRDIQRLSQEDLRRRWRMQRLDRVVHAIDDLLFQLEDLNLQGVDRVPAVLRERASQILDAVPGREEYEVLRVRYRVVPMMDVLFRAQEVLFRLRDPLRSIYEAEDAEEDAAASAATAAAMGAAGFAAMSDGAVATQVGPPGLLAATTEVSQAAELVAAGAS